MGPSAIRCSEHQPEGTSAAAYARLYPRTKRDAIISYGIVHQMPLGEINDKLFAEGEKTLL